MHRAPRGVLSWGHYRLYTSQTKVWALTDGGIESSLRTLALARHLGNDVRLKKVETHKALQMLPTILQSFFVRPKKVRKELPWYLTSSESLDEETPDFVISSDSSSILACLHVVRANPKKAFSVYMGFTNLPFIHFDLVTLPKYEANAKMAKLGPLAQQRNCIVTNTPLLDSVPPRQNPSLWMKRHFPLVPTELLSTHPMAAIVIGGQSSQCRWYSEDIVTLVDYMRRMVIHHNYKLVVVFTEKTPDLIKDRIMKGTASILNHELAISLWDTANVQLTEMDKVEAYETLIDHANRVVLTADLDYATAHAASRRKPVYIAFGGRCQSYLLHFHRWARDHHLTRKLRLDRSSSAMGKKKNVDVFSYLGIHPPFADGRRVLDIPNIVEFVSRKALELRKQQQTGKRAAM